MNKEKKNLISLIFGIILIFVGLGGTSVTIPMNDVMIIILPIVILIIGAILSILGGLRKW